MNKNKLEHDKVKSNVQVAPKCDDLKRSGPSTRQRGRKLVT